jgi:hypothetical protein
LGQLVFTVKISWSVEAGAPLCIRHRGFQFRPLLYVKGWAAKYKDAGLVVIGVHSPEFSFERERKNVGNAVRDLAVSYPVAIDSERLIWQAFDNKYWPARFFIDGKGRIHYHHFGDVD